MLYLKKPRIQKNDSDRFKILNKFQDDTEPSSAQAKQNEGAVEINLPKKRSVARRTKRNSITVVSCLVWLTFVPCLAFGQVDKLIKQLHHPKDKKVMVAAHRGDWRNAPENSLQAYQSAISMDVDMIEVDLKMSRDSVLVIVHDQTLNRSTTGKGKPSDYTLAELKAFKLRDGLGAPTRQQIPTLEEVMLLAKGKVLVNLDHSFPFYREAYQVLIKTGTLAQALFKTEKHYAELKARYPELLDKITFMAVVELDEPGGREMILEYQQHMKPVAVELVFGSDTSSVIRDARFISTGGSKVWVNSLWPNISGGHDDELAISGDLKNSWDWLIARGVTMIQTDRPRELLAYLRKRKLHK